MMWCTTARLPGPGFDRLDPLVFFEARIDREVLIVDRALRLELCTASRPCSRLCPGPSAAASRRRISAAGGTSFGSPSGAPAADPLVEDFLFVSGHAAVVVEVSELGVGEPRRHPAIADNFGDRVGPAGDFFVVRHREGGDLTRPMAADAPLIEDPRDLVGVGHLRGRVGGVHAADEAADGSRLGLRTGLAGQKFVDGRVADTSRAEPSCA